MMMMRNVVAVGIICIGVVVVDDQCALGLQRNAPPDRGRRRLLQKAITAGSGAFLLPQFNDWLHPPSLMSAAAAAPTGSESDPVFYQVIPDASASLDPTLTSLKESTFLSRLLPANGRGGSVWLGEHHNSERDHIIQARLIREIASRRKGKPTAVGLEQVQLQFQPVLDLFVAREISMKQMKERVEWEERWMWPFEVYEPVFVACQELKIPLIALNVNSEDLTVVEKYGYQGFSPQQRKQYIKDPVGFAGFVNQEQYRAYADYVIRPSYDVHQAMGLLKHTMSGEELDTEMPFRNFFSSRILWDECMAQTAFSWTEAHEGGLVIGLVGSDHVKFRNGIPGRFARMARAGTRRNGFSCISVMLNPTSIDSRPSGSVSTIPGADSARYPDRLTLQLRYLKDGIPGDSPSRSLPSSTGGVLPLADYLVLS